MKLTFFSSAGRISTTRIQAKKLCQNGSCWKCCSDDENQSLYNIVRFSTVGWNRTLSKILWTPRLHPIKSICALFFIGFIQMLILCQWNKTPPITILFFSDSIFQYVNGSSFLIHRNEHYFCISTSLMCSIE